MSKRVLISLLVFGIVISLAIGGVAFADQATPVTITVLTQYYTGTVGPQQFPKVNQMMLEIAKQYEQLHPNVTINFIPWTFTGANGQTTFETWLVSQFAAGTEPDISWEQCSNTWIQPGWWMPLNSYLETPDPYAAAGAGKEHWKDCLPDFVWSAVAAPNGDYYTLATDWIETGLFYNKAIFDKLGLSPNFTSWDQFMQTLKTLKEHGYIGLGLSMSNSQWSVYQWLDDIVTTACFADKVPQMYMQKYSELYKTQTYDGEEWRVLTPEEVAKAIYDGLYSANSPEFVEFLNIIKALSQYFPNGFTSNVDNTALFYSGKEAMLWSTSGQVPLLRQSQPPFEWGITYLPPFSTQQIPQLPKMFQDVSFRVGGPTATGQFNISMGAVKKGVASWAVDFLKYLSTPNTMGKVINEEGADIPMITGTPMATSLAFFKTVASYPVRAFMDPIGRFTPTYTTEYDTVIENYLTGTIDMKTAQQEIQSIFDSFAKSMALEYHYSWYK